MEKWTYETNISSEFWRGGIYETKEETIRNGRKEAIEENKQSFKIGMVEEANNYGIDVDQVIETIQEAVYEDVGEVAEDYLDDATKEDLLELEKQLNDVFYKWQEKHHYKPTFYKVVTEEIIKVEEK